MARHGKSKARAKRPPPAMPKPAPHRYTMQQEARNTETHNRWWETSNLRHKAVQFVSAGQLEQSETEDADDQEEPTSEAPCPQVNKAQNETPAEPEPDIEESLFFVDSTGDRAVAANMPNPAMSSVSDTDEEDESEDEVVFTGRHNARMPIRIETDEVQLLESLNIQAVQPPQPSAPVDQPKETVPSRTMPHPKHRQQWSPADEVDMLADYIANIDQDYKKEIQDVEVDTQMDEGGMDVLSPRSEPENKMSSTVINAGSSQEKLSDELLKADMDIQADLPSNSEDEKDVPHSLEFSSESSEDEDDDEDEDIELLEQLAISHILQGGNRGGGRGKHGFPSATAFADALDSDPYYGFDIMDFDRPSLQKKSKGQRAPPLNEYMNSDSELEAQLQWAWETDRQKKKSRKKEREELRSQGLLGRNSDDADLKVKYAKGMHIEELISEIRTFLLSSKTSLSLPPMTKNRRKSIHELASKVNLKSQSRGNGKDRFPVLIKTARTSQYTRKTISQVDNLLGGRKFSRRLFQSWNSDTSKPSKPKRAGGGGVTAGVTYTDGEVVGASAPEIGAGNRGRAMLEKMGWSSGTALGASNNKGILQPVTHVVKNSRAGLG